MGVSPGPVPEHPSIQGEVALDGDDVDHGNEHDDGGDDDERLTWLTAPSNMMSTICGVSSSCSTG